MMSSTNEEDPFLQVQHDVLSQINAARGLFASYLRIRSLAASSSSSSPPSATISPELASARADLESVLSTLAEDLADLLESVRAAEADPSRFGITPDEIRRRARLVQEVGGEVDDMRDELEKAGPSSQSTAATTSSGKKSPLGGGGGGGGGGDLPHPSSFAIRDGTATAVGDSDAASDADGADAYAAFEQEQQQAMMREQDAQLDDVFRTVGNLRRQADDMGRELEEQREMIVEVDALADRVGGRLASGMQKLQYIVARNEDTLSSWCIGLLVFVLVVLLALLITI